MVNLWFTDKDIKYRWSEVKYSFWDEFENRIKMSAKRMLEETLKAEQMYCVGAGRYQRGKQRRDWRNGYYTRDVVWKLGLLSKVSVPRSRGSAYRTQILERYRRFGGGFDHYMLKLFTLGLATRRVEQFFTYFFGQYSVGSQTVSDILKRVSGELEQFHSRRFKDNIKYLYLDGLYVTIRSAFKRKYVLLFAMAEYEDGRRELLDFSVATSEKTVHWQYFLDRLYRRGLKGRHLKLIVTDGAGGLLDAVQTVYGGVPLQVCWVHRQRNLVRHLKKSCHRKPICADATGIFMAENHQKAIKFIHRFQQRWHPKEPRAVRLFLKDIDLSLTFFKQPKEKWKHLASNNLIERQMREFRRRIKLIDSFRDENCCERIIYTQIIHLNKVMELNHNS